MPSTIRILQGTPAIATSTNFPNIKQVIQLKNTISKDLDNIIQRLGRAGRAISRAKAVLYLLQYINNRIYYIPKYGASKEHPNYQSIIPRLAKLDTALGQRTRKIRKLAKYRQPKAVVVYTLRRPSSLRYIETLADNYTSIEDRADNEEFGADIEDTVADIESSSRNRRSSTSYTDNNKFVVSASTNTYIDLNPKGRSQTNPQIDLRDSLVPIIRRIQNAFYYLVPVQRLCFRTVLYKYYSESERQYLLRDSVTVLGIADCYSYYNLALLDLTKQNVDIPELLKPVAKPRAGTKAYFVLGRLEVQLKDRTSRRFKDTYVNLLFIVPSAAIILLEKVYELCRLFNTILY